MITWQQARRHLSEKAVRHRVRSGRWRRVHHGIYVAHTGPITERQRWWIASLGAGSGRAAPLAGVTALRLHGFRSTRPAGGDHGPVHVLVPHRLSDRNPPPDVIIHRTRHLPMSDVFSSTLPPSTTPARAMIDAAQWALTDTAAITVIAASFQQRIVTADQVVPLLEVPRKLVRRSVIEAAVRDANGGSESVYEVEFLRLCRRSGLPEPSRQSARTDRSGRTRYRDVYFDRWRVQVEIDGAQHMEVRGWYSDIRSGNEAAISGVRLLRFPGWMVRHRPDEVIADVRAALRAAGWRGERPRIRSPRAA